MKNVIEENSTTFGWKSLALVFATAVAVRIAAMLVLRSWEFQTDWEFGFELSKLGRSLANGNGFTLNEGESPTAAFPPVYPLVIAVFFSVFGSYSQAAAVAIFLFQSVCAGLVAILLGLIGTRLWNYKAGLIAGFVWAFYPTSIFYSVIHVWYCELAATLLLFAVTIAIMARPPASFTRVFLFGALSGLVILTDPTAAIYLALLLLWMLLIQKVKVPNLLALLLVGGVTVALVVSPWAIYNWFLHGSPRIVKSNFGEALFLGNHPLAVGENTSAERKRAYATLDPKELNYYRSQPEFVADRYFMGKAMEWIQSHPLRFARLTAYRIGYFWTVNTTLGPNAWLRFAYYGPLLGLALYGIWIGIPRLWDLAPVWLFLLIQPLPYYVTHVAAGRYSYPVEPFVVLLAAVPMSFWLTRWLSLWSESRTNVVNAIDSGQPT
jgi:4-amino-4-deoxy-L-arabinose transferase-like glycosyltransferase